MHGSGAPSPDVATGDAAPPRADATPVDRRPGSPRRRVLWGGLVVAWFLTLAVLAWRTANPSQLNLRQLAQSDLVVVLRDGVVEEVLPLRGQTPPPVEDLLFAPPPHLPANESRLVPIRRTRLGYETVAVRLNPDTPPVVLTYPDDEPTRTAIARWLDDTDAESNSAKSR